MAANKKTGIPLLRSVFIVVVTFSLWGCSPKASVKNTSWMEFHGSNGNTGYTNFPSKAANKLKWQFPTGDVLNATPVVDDDGTIYIGNTTGDLFGINPDGTQKWKQHLVGLLSSAAIGASGNLYVTNVQKITDSIRSSSLFSLDKNGHGLAKWWYAFPDFGFTTAPPKTWSNGTDEFIFVPVHTKKGEELFTFINNNGAELVDRQPADCLPDELEGGSSNPFQFQVSGISFDPIFVKKAAVAISSANTNDHQTPIIVYTPDNCHMMGFSLDVVKRKLNKIWTAPYVFNFYPTPAVTANEQIIEGHGKSLFGYSLLTGKKLWEFVQGTPSSPDYEAFYDSPGVLLNSSPSYNLYTSHIVAVDYTGTKTAFFWTKNADDNNTDACPLVTTTNVYAAFPSGLYTLDLQLGLVDHINFIPGPKKTLLSSPAIGPDGTIYMVDANGILEAFGNKNQ